MIRALQIAGLSCVFSLPVTAGQEGERDYFMLYAMPDLVFKYDIEKDEVVSTVKTRHGVIHDRTMSHDEKELFFVTAKQAHVEVLDIAKMEFTEDHNFERPDWIIRVDGVREVPGGEQWYVSVDRVRRKPDRFIIEEGQLFHYDRAEREVLKEMKELPSAIRRSGPGQRAFTSVKMHDMITPACASVAKNTKFDWNDSQAIVGSVMTPYTNAAAPPAAASAQIAVSGCGRARGLAFSTGAVGALTGDLRSARARSSRRSTGPRGSCASSSACDLGQARSSRRYVHP